MLADLVSTPVLTGATFIYIFSAGVEAQDLRGAFPLKRMVLVGVFTVRPP
jgi:hypothetical protein